MAVTNELAFPTSEDQFEEMCFHLYRKEWNDPGCTRLGGAGQAQFGLDIIGSNGAQQIGIQCKHYAKKPFTLATVEGDIAKADSAGIDVDHLIFATSAANKSELVLKVRELSNARKKAGKFTVSVAFWQELSGMLRLNKEVAREYIPEFPGGTLLQVQETTEAMLAIVKSSSERAIEFQSDVISRLDSRPDQVSSTAAASNLPQSQGTEAEPLIAKNLDLVRSKLLDGLPKDAVEILESLGNPDRFRDTYSQFRWHTNRAAAHLLDGKKVEAAREYLTAAAIDPKLEKAWCNKAHAYLLLDEAEQSLAASREGLQTYPESAPLWALQIGAKHFSGDPEPDSEVPKHLLGTSDVMFALSYLRSKQGRLEESLDQIRLCAKGDAPSLEIRRSYLAAALSWATEDPVAAHYDQLLPKQRETLTEALQLMEPLEATIASLQVDSVSEEVANNVCVALLLTRDWVRARAIAASALARHPTLEGLLRIRVNELADKDDLVGLRKLTDGQYDDLPSSTLAALAEVSANKGDLGWHHAVMAVLFKRENSAQQASELRALTIHAHYQAGEKVKAIELANDLLAEQPNHVLTHVLLSQMLYQQGEILRATQQTDLAIRALQSDSPMADVLHVADMLYDHNRYPEASALYERIVTSPGANGLTQRHLACLIESGQRRKASEILEALPADIRDKPPFRRIESNLARQMGDWPRMRDVLKHELDRVPTDSGVAVGYIGALHRIPSEEATLKAYLASDPSYDGKQPFNEVEIAKYQREKGYPELAIKRLYRLFRAHPNDSALGGYFLAQVLIGKLVPELTHAPVVAAPGVAVHLGAGGKTRGIAIDFEESVEGASWPELVTPNSEQANSLIGLSLGDKVTISIGLGEIEYEVMGLTPLYAFAAEKAHKLLAEAANPGGPLWSVNLEKADGSIDLEPLLAMTRHKSARIADALTNYTQLRFPLAILAKLIGCEPLTLMLEWPGRKASLFVSLGTHEEREQALALLAEGKKRFVIDLPTLGELVMFGVFRAVAPILGRPLVPQTAREELANIIQFQETAPAQMSLREEDGQYIREEPSQEQLDRRLALLREMLACMDELCDVLPVLGPKTITDSHRNLEEWLDSATLDAVYLALEHDAVLLSDDGGLRLVTPEVGLLNSIAVQPLLMFARERGVLPHATYVDVIMRSLARNHDFISIRTEDLVAVAKRNTSKVATEVMAAFDTFRSRTLDLISGVQVCGEFIVNTMAMCQPAITKEYFRLALTALQHDRAIYADDIHRALAHSVEKQLGGIRKRKASSLRREMGELLKPPAPQKQRIRMSPIALAVMKLFSRR